jgi:hypothetical protein
MHFEAIERIETPGCLREFPRFRLEKSPWEAEPPTAQVWREETPPFYITDL